MEETRYIDLHTHSCFSDGSCTPEELIELANQSNLAGIALTDHDTIKGLERFHNAAQKHPSLRAISGVEISTAYESREMHFVGLFIDENNQDLLDFLEEMRQSRIERNQTLAYKLKALGFPVDIDRMGGPDNHSLGRPNFAKFIMENYPGFDSMQDVFDRLLKRNAGAFVQRKLPTPYEAIDAINRAGGLPVWAHPVRRHGNETRFVKRMLKKLVPAGLGGIECYYSMFGPEETTMLLAAAKEFGIAPSGGSDFHGEHSPGISLGLGGGALHVPDSLLSFCEKRK